MRDRLAFSVSNRLAISISIVALGVSLVANVAGWTANHKHIDDLNRLAESNSSRIGEICLLNKGFSDFLRILLDASPRDKLTKRQRALVEKIEKIEKDTKKIDCRKRVNLND